MKPRYWTKTAIECYQRGCACKECQYAKYFHGRYTCKMKKTVLESVKLFGKPKGAKEKTVVEET